MLAEEKDDGGAAEPQGRSAPRKKKLGKTSRLRTRNDLDKILSLAGRNRNKMAILQALYIHRHLDIFQIRRVAVPHMNLKALGNLMGQIFGEGLVDRKTDEEINIVKGDEQKFYYFLKPRGLDALTDHWLQVRSSSTDPDSPKRHYLIEDLKVTEQRKHHYYNQEVVTRFLGDCRDKGMVFPHAEWRRFPLEDPALTKRTHYRPDWLIFQPNSHYTELVNENRTGECPLHTPVESRSELQKAILASHYPGWLAIECDMKTESLTKVRNKCAKFKETLHYYPTLNMAFYSINGRYSREQLLPIRHLTHNTRTLNGKKAIIEILQDELIEGKTQVLHGDEYTCRVASLFFMEHGGNMMAGYPTQDEFAAIRKATPKTDRVEIVDYSLEDIRKLKVSQTMPVYPDDVVVWSKEGQTEVHMIFFARLGWVNPIARANAVHEWIVKTKQKMKVVLVYPTMHDLINEVHFEQNQYRYVIWEEIQQKGTWGHYKRVRTGILKNQKAVFVEDEEI
jgi:hypothetical protein